MNESEDMYHYLKIICLEYSNDTFVNVDEMTARYGAGIIGNIKQLNEQCFISVGEQGMMKPTLKGWMMVEAQLDSNNRIKEFFRVANDTEYRL